MTKRSSTALAFAAIFIVAVVIIVLTAYSVGADPFHPRTRHIWLLSLIAAAYFTFRMMVIYKKIRKGREDWGAFSWWLKFPARKHPIDRRMAARRERVAAAKAKDVEENETKTVNETDND